VRRTISSITKQKAKDLRKTLTPSEIKLWKCFRQKQFLGLHVRKQHPVGPYIADFCIEKLKLIIEVDGYTHDHRIGKDKKRDQHQLDLGYEVIRIQSKDVMSNVEGVIDFLESICEKRFSTPTFSPPNLGENS
jgi:very-short-patch-repair endonuclease